MALLSKQNKRLVPLIFSMLYCLYTQAEQSSVQPYIIVDSFSYSETVSLESTLDGWKGGGFHSGERQWSWNWVELGVQYRHWGIGLLKRYDYDLRFSKETAEFYWLVANKKELANGRQYDLDLSINAIHSSGLRLSYFKQWSDAFNLRLGLAYLQADYMLDGDIEGAATADSESSLDYDFSAQLDYHYSEDLLFDRVVDQPSGKGFALDLEFNYQLTPELHWQLQVRDLLTRIYWHNSPYTTGSATSDRKEYDQDGYVSFNPVLTGYEGTSGTYVQKLDPRWYSRMDYQLTPAYDAVFQYRYQYDHGLYALGGSYRFTASNRLGLSYWPINQALEVNWRYHQAEVAIVADGLAFSDVNTLWVSFSYGI